METLSNVRMAIVGCTGFVGGTLADHLPKADGYNSKNIEDIAGKAYDVIICAGLPAAKWWINQHPDEDLANLKRLQIALSKAQCTVKFVLISTIDVHDTTRPDAQNEDHVTPANHAYGRHRLMMEAWVKEQYPGKWRLLRLPGLFGVGLKKNIIFDLLTDNMVDKICVNHKFQWYDMRHLIDDVSRACDKSERTTTYNLYSEPVGVNDMIQAVFPEFWERLKDNHAPNPVVYAIKTSLTPSGWAYTKDQVLQELREFVDVQRKMAAGWGKLLSVSNLAWPLEQESHALQLLEKYGIANLEVAPTRYGKWGDDDDGCIDAEAVRTRIEQEAAGLRIYSTQAVFFGSSVNLFDDPTAFEAHMCRVIQTTARFGAKRIVLGSPKNRLLPAVVEANEQHKDRDLDTYERLAEEVLERIGEYAAQHYPDVVVCLEPNSRKYGCNFVTTLAEAFGLLQGVKSANVGINLDTGNAEMEGEDVNRVLDACTPAQRARIKHIQVSQPFLAPLDLDAMAAPGKNNNLPQALRAMFPDHVLSLEMKEVCPTLLPRCIFDLYRLV